MTNMALLPTAPRTLMNTCPNENTDILARWQKLSGSVGWAAQPRQVPHPVSLRVCASFYTSWLSGTGLEWNFTSIPETSR